MHTTAARPFFRVESVIEKAIESGVKCIAVHKYFPIGPTRLSAYDIDDVEVAGMFPQINFESSILASPSSTRRPGSWPAIRTSTSTSNGRDAVHVEPIAGQLWWR